MKIKIIAVGGLIKEYKAIIAKYYDRINAYATIQISEIKEINESNIELKVQKETILIEKLIPKNTIVYLCSLKGEAYTSEQFAKLMNVPSITFIIGGSNGVDESKFANKIQFSSLTFPHQLFRVILVEQIYRAQTILNNGQYHK